jgi:hypothetical protein
VEEATKFSSGEDSGYCNVRVGVRGGVCKWAISAFGEEDVYLTSGGFGLAAVNFIGGKCVDGCFCMSPWAFL